MPIVHTISLNQLSHCTRTVAVAVFILRSRDGPPAWDKQARWICFVGSGGAGGTTGPPH